MDEFAELLAPTELTTVDAELEHIAGEIAADLGPAEAARAIADWVRDHVEYEPGSTGVQTSAQEAWSLRKGVCQDIAHLSVGMLRAVGIPARYVSGYLYPKAGRRRSARRWPASRTPGSSGGAASGPGSTRPTVCRPACGTCWSPTAGTTGM